MESVFEVDDQGEPRLKQTATRLASGEIFAGWWSIQRSAQPFNVALRHGLGVPLYTSHLWIFVRGSAQFGYPLMCRMPHSAEAGPVLIQQTAEAAYCYYEANKPVFARYDEGTGTYDLINEAWLGALIRPVAQSI